jgi:hypothetical protein
MSTTIKQLEQRIKALEEWQMEKEHERHTYQVGHNIAAALLAKGGKFDLRLVAKLQALLGVKLVEVAAKAPKAVKKGLNVKSKKNTR